MAEELFVFAEAQSYKYMISGWRRQWSNGGRISSRLPRYLIDKLNARKIGSMSDYVNNMCYPFQVAGTHDIYRPAAAFNDGLPSSAMNRENDFYDAGDGLVVFLGEEPWYRLDIYAEAFFSAVQKLGIKQVVAVEGVNGPAPPDLERRITCTYSKSEMKTTLERYGVQFSSYGSDSRRGPTIGMALVSMAHYEYSDIEMFRFGALAPMYPFVSGSSQQTTITTDRRSFYDIMIRLNAIFGLSIDLSELKSLGDAESQELSDALEKMGSSSEEARQIIDQVRDEYSYTPFIQPVELDPLLDQALQDILENISLDPEE